jgi:hypothetical protein
MSTSAISAPDAQRRPRFQQRIRFPEQIQHFEKSRCQHNIGLRSPEQLGDVPIKEAKNHSAFAIDARVLQITAGSDLPRDVDKAVGGARRAMSFVPASRHWRRANDSMTATVIP